MRRREWLRLSGLAVAALAGCSGGDPGSTLRRVEMTDDLQFVPETVTVSTGAPVEWRNVGGVRHTVTAYDDGIPESGAYFASGGFDAERAARNHVQEGLLETDETYRHTFEVAGTYEYFCIPHESSGMTGTVRVR